MKYKRILLTCLCVITATVMLAANKVKTKAAEVKVVNGVTIRVSYLSDDIVRVVKYPGGGAMPERQSFSVVLKEGGKVNTPNVSATIDGTTGSVTFRSRDGKVLLRETTAGTMKRYEDGADKGRMSIAQTWTLDAGEAIYGLGQLRDTAMVWRGRTMKLWNHNTYIAIPYVTSEKGYGLYWDNAGRSEFKDNAEGMTFSSEVADVMDYYFIYRDGTQDGVMAGVRELGGQATMFPLWAMGHWQCRERYKTSDELCGVLDRYRELQIPLDAIVQDWQYWGCDSNWNAMRFQNPYYINKVGDPAWEKYLPKDLQKMAAEYKAKGLKPRIKSPEEMAEYVHKNNAHLMISIWANFGPWTEGYSKMKEIDALLPFETWPRKKGVRPYDVYNPKARDLYWQQLMNLYRVGFDAWWTDSTEPDHFEAPGDDSCMTYAGTWRSVKNAFPLMTNRGIYEHQRATKDNTKRSLQMTRSGTFGLQRYGTFSWSGDISASWAEMKRQVPSGLNYVLCGIPFWNTDLGGFFYHEYQQSAKNPALQELQVRWMQWGAFMPLMRNHCSSPMVSEIYEFGKPGDWAYDAMVDAVKLRYRLLPYIYSMMGEVVQHSGMMMRPLVMDFVNDKKAIRLNNEYMFGHALLVKPVTDPLYTWKDEKKRGHEIYPEVKKAKAPYEVYLPSGTHWYDFFTGEQFDGGCTVKRPTPITDMPVYVRAGSIIPFGPDVQYSSEKAWDNLDIHVYPGADGQFTLYEDEGDGYNYERGQFTEISFKWEDATRTLTIGEQRGKFRGMLKTRKFNVILPDGTWKTATYSGNAISVTL